MKRSPEFGTFEGLPKDIHRVIVSIDPLQFWNVNKYFRAISYELLPLNEKQKALWHAARKGYLDMLSHLLVIIKHIYLYNSHNYNSLNYSHIIK